MAILYGTQSNGETLPVLVDQFGNLLAKGIDGTQGPQGPPGPDGPPGQDGGDFPLPPDPEDGDVLGWQDNQLAWISEPPIPQIPGWNNSNDSCKVMDPVGNVLVVPDNLAALEQTVGWLNPQIQDQEGGEVQDSADAYKASPMNFYVPDSFGKVITFYFKARGTFQNNGYTNMSRNLLFSSDKITQLSITGSPDAFVRVGDPAFAYFYFIASYIWSEDDDTFTVSYETPAGTGLWATAQSWMCGYEISDAGNYAVTRQNQLLDEVRALKSAIAAQANS